MDNLPSTDCKHAIECEVSMPDEICVNESNNIIEIVYAGILTRKDIESTRTKFQEILAEKSIDSIFVDITRLESTPSIFDIFEIISSIPAGLKIAMLITPSSPIIREVTFAETVGRNRGTTIKICLDRNEARQWLGTFND
jgi:hypothetical protein